MSNLLDRAIEYLSPRWAAKRAFYRSYDGGRYDIREAMGWKAYGTDANAEVERDLATLRNRSRDLVRNNPLAANGIKILTNAVVGKELKPKFFLSSGEPAKQIQKRWEEWTSGPVDYEGIHSMSAIQRLALRSMLESGEVLFGPVSEVRGRNVSMRIQLWEADYLDTERTEAAPTAGHRIRNGVEFDAQGKRVAYWVYPEHPGNQEIPFAADMTSKPVPVDRMRTMFRVERPGQVRGVPLLAPVMLTLKNLQDYEQTKLIQQKIAACYAAFIFDSDPVGSQSHSEKIPTTFEPGMIPILPAGKDIRVATPPQPNGDDRFIWNHQHNIATGLGVTYEALTGDWSGVNYSSARMGWIENNREIVALRRILIKYFLDSIAEWWLKTNNSFRSRGVTWNWCEPRRELVDPVKEGAARIADIQGGLLSLSEAIRESGRNPDEVLPELAADMKLAQSLGLTLSTDPANAQKPQPADSTADSGGGA